MEPNLKPNEQTPDLLVVGSGPSGMMAAIVAARAGAAVTIVEQMPKPGMKLLATGGRRCNLTNTRSPAEIMEDFGRTGRFMEPAMDLFNNDDLRAFFHDLGVPTHSPDGFRVWPATHKATSIHNALLGHARELGIRILCDRTVDRVVTGARGATGVIADGALLPCRTLLLATGGLSLSSTGATGSGYTIAAEAGHTIRPTFPSGVPLHAREDWTAACTAHTIPKVRALINPATAAACNGGKPMKGIRGVRATGDLIFTRKGIAGPLALDLSRELAPLLARYAEIPLELNLVKGHNEESVLTLLRELKAAEPATTIDGALAPLAPPSLRAVLLDRLDTAGSTPLRHLAGRILHDAAVFLTRCRLTIHATAGYSRAIATRGGVSLKDIDPATLMSRRVPRLYFSGELVDLDGPCGGYNLTWAFCSGHLAGIRAAADAAGSGHDSGSRE